MTIEEWDKLHEGEAPLEGLVRRYNGIGWCWVRQGGEMDKLFTTWTEPLLQKEE